MGLRIRDIETVEREYRDKDILSIDQRGIRLSDIYIDFRECVRDFPYSSERMINERLYVGARNPLTESPYMKFRIGGEDVFVTFSTREGFYDLAERIREFGYDTFDLS